MPQSMFGCDCFADSSGASALDSTEDMAVPLCLAPLRHSIAPVDMGTYCSNILGDGAGRLGSGWPATLLTYMDKHLYNDSIRSFSREPGRASGKHESALGRLAQGLSCLRQTDRVALWDALDSAYTRPCWTGSPRLADMKNRALAPSYDRFP